MNGKYSYCPNCGRKGVYWRAWTNGEDHYLCRYKDCDFYFYTSSNSKIDKVEEGRWKQAQPKVAT